MALQSGSPLDQAIARARRQSGQQIKPTRERTVWSEEEKLAARMVATAA
jgi:hypothetical protein